MYTYVKNTKYLNHLDTHMQFLAIFNYWFSSLSIFRPRAFFSLMMGSSQRFIYGLQQTIMFFWWIFSLDIMLNMIFKKYLIIDAQSTASDGGNLTSVAIFALIVSISWLILSTTFTLFVRSRSDQLTNTNYLKVFFIKYVHMNIMFGALCLLLLALILSLGITTFPKDATWFLLSLQLLSMITMFFWLDSPGNPKDVLISLEKSTNLLIYNIPFFASIILFALGLSWGFEYLIAQWAPMHEQKPILEAVIELFKPAPEWLTAIIILLIKYVSILAKFFMISMIYTYYKQKRSKIYAQSLFE